MGAAALTARLPIVRPRRRPAEGAACGLRFNQVGGPLVAVCGLTGGAGTSTLSFLLARQAACDSIVPVLLTEQTSDGGDLAALAGRAAPLGLRELANHVARGEQPERVFCEPEPGLRLLASTPRPEAETAHADVERVLDHGRGAHGLVVIDCGQRWRHDPDVLKWATHIIWTLPASPVAVRRAQLLLAAGALPRPAGAREILAASATHPRQRAAVRELRRLARVRCDRLLLVPHLPGLPAGRLDDDRGRLTNTLTALATALRPA